jgi:hypothetical protein
MFERVEPPTDLLDLIVSVVRTRQRRTVVDPLLLMLGRPVAADVVDGLPEGVGGDVELGVFLGS